MTLIEEPQRDARDAPAGRNGRATSDTRYWPVWQISVTRFKEFYRHPSAVFWVYVFPILMAIVLGVAFENTQTVAVDVDVEQAPGAEAVARALNESAEVKSATAIKAVVSAADDARLRLRTGRVDLVILSRASAPGNENPALADLDVDYIYDSTRPESVEARRIVDDQLQRAAGRRDPIEAKDQIVHEPGGRYIDFVVPGLIGASLMSGGLWGIGFIVVDLRVRHLLKRFVTTPMKKSDFLAGLILSRFVFMVTEVILMLVFTRWLFDVRILGSWFALALFVALGSWAFAGIGLVIACRAQTLETASGIINLVLLPMWLVSGIFFRSDRFPEAVQPLIKILPLTALIDAMRAIMLEGAGLAGTWPQLAVLAIWTVACFFVSLRFFRWY